MYHYQTQNIFDQEIDFILRFLFEYDSPEQKRQSFAQAQALFQQLDLASHYLLFSLVKERLPRRAKLLFAAEDYSGKKEVIMEVMRHWVGCNSQEHAA
ncbi:hypothetical protein E0H88_06665 [Acinetobacter sp. ANC 4216]|uniref:hypothetical protein n=1 Tax=Acinetobacter sp. ANC 4216 TaxID=2529840 RepID=UPI00103B6A4B|nr:hypothetical protein [Acinetobacter sp. ANC 4216]TCB70985.1 hypothetical protein E0H88_06665 [Acinetobacter sp. ANC 4216]